MIFNFLLFQFTGSEVNDQVVITSSEGSPSLKTVNKDDMVRIVGR